MTYTVILKNGVSVVVNVCINCGSPTSLSEEIVCF